VTSIYSSAGQWQTQDWVSGPQAMLFPVLKRKLILAKSLRYYHHLGFLEQNVIDIQRDANPLKRF
jgi:hypothetical protein